MDWKTGRLPLKGLRVIDWSVYWAGPYLSMTLHDLGAEVIKIESPSSWDPMRTVIDVNRGVRGTQKPMTPQERSNISQHFNEWNRGKLGLAVELREARGRDRSSSTSCASADIFIENHRPHVKEKLRITYDDLREVKPDLIYVSLSGYGQTLPDRDAMALGSPVEVASGLFSLNGYLNDPTPAKTGFSYGDPVGALTALSGVLLALRNKRRTGEGSYLDIALRDSLSFGIGAAFTAESMDGTATTPRPARPEASKDERTATPDHAHRGNRHPVYAPQGVYRALGEDEWVAISVRDDADWAALAEPLGNADLARRPALRHRRRPPRPPRRARRAHRGVDARPARPARSRSRSRKPASPPPPSSTTASSAATRRSTPAACSARSPTPPSAARSAPPPSSSAARRRRPSTCRRRCSASTTTRSSPASSATRRTKSARWSATASSAARSWRRGIDGTRYPVII